jgi:hypothetical protein
MNGFTDEQWVRYQAEHTAAATEMLYRNVRDKATEVHNEKLRELRPIGGVIASAVTGNPQAPAEVREFWARIGDRK